MIRIAKAGEIAEIRCAMNASGEVY